MLLNLPPEIVLEIVDACLLISPLTYLSLIQTSKAFYRPHTGRPARHFEHLPSPSRFQQALHFELHKKLKGPALPEVTEQVEKVQRKQREAREASTGGDSDGTESSSDGEAGPLPVAGKTHMLLIAAQAYDQILAKRLLEEKPLPEGQERINFGFMNYRRVTRFVSLLVDEIHIGSMTLRTNENDALRRSWGSRGEGDCVQYRTCPEDRIFALPPGTNSRPPRGLGMELLKEWVKEQLGIPQEYTENETTYTTTIFLVLISLAARSCGYITRYPHQLDKPSPKDFKATYHHAITGTPIDYDTKPMTPLPRHKRALFVGRVVRAVFTVALWEKVVKKIDGKYRIKLLELIFHNAKKEGGLDWEDWGLWLTLSDNLGGSSNSNGSGGRGGSGSGSYSHSSSLTPRY